MRRPYLIGIGGPSGAGKTTLAQALQSVWAPAEILSTDSYYHDLSALDAAERERTNFDSPEALDWELLVSHLEALRRGEPIEVPVYDFAAHMRRPERRPLAAGDLLLVEGLFALCREQTRRLYDFSVYVSAPMDVCFERRLQRDISERGRSPQSVIEQFEKTVWPMAEQHVIPAARFANLVVDTRSELHTLIARCQQELGEALRGRAAARRTG